MGNVSIPGMTADLTRVQRSLRFIQDQKSQCYNVDLRFMTNQHPPGSAHKRGSPASFCPLIGGCAVVDNMMTSALVYKK